MWCSHPPPHDLGCHVIKKGATGWEEGRETPVRQPPGFQRWAKQGPFLTP